MENKKIKKSEYPEAIVGAIVENEDGLILLAKSKHHHGKYVFFGGHVELGESLEEAVKREIKEEAGINVEIKKKIDFSEAVFVEDLLPGKHYVFCDFVCEYKGDKDAVKLDDTEYEPDSYVWVDPEGALKMDIASTIERTINAYLLEKKKEEYLSGWQRCLADFENYKKRQLESNRFLESHAKEGIILEILPVIDNFEASLAHIPKESKDDPWVTGITYIQKQLEDILEREGVKIIETKAGDEFNPALHEAIERKGEKSKTNEIKEVVQKGYKIGDKIIRAVKVVVK